MKKICLLLAVCLIVSCFAGCGGASEPTQPSADTEATTQATTQPTTEPSETTEPPTTEPPTTEPPVRKVIGYEIDIPEEFIASVAKDDEEAYVSPNAPNDTSAILIRVMPGDEDVLTLDEEGFETLSALDADYRKVALEQTKVDGYDALFADYTVRQDGEYVHIYEYHVVTGEQNYMFRFSDATDENDWLELYEEVAQTITLLLEDEPLHLDYSGLESYRLDCGIRMYAEAGLEQQDAPGFTDCVGNPNAIVLVMQDNKETHGLVGLSLEDYADLVSDANDLEGFTQDKYGNLHTSFYSTDETGVRYYNFLTVKETGDSFWVFQMTCAATDQAAYDRQFSLWATSIEEA